MLALHRSALIAGIVLVLSGFLLFPPWEPQLSKYAAYALPRLLVVLLVGGWLARSLRLPLAAALLAALVLTLLIFHGVVALVSLTLLLLAGLGVGSWLSPPATPADAVNHSHIGESGEAADSAVFACLVGGGVIAGGVAWLLPWPIFSQASLATVLLVICLLRRRAISSHLKSLRRQLSAAIREAPHASAAMVAVLWLATMPAWLPVLSSDDLATHLQLGWQLQTLGYYRMDVGSQVWSLAPWLVDVNYGLLHLLAGGEAVGPLNALWLCLTAWVIVRLSQTIGLRGSMPWLAAMLYVSVPVVGGLSLSMQTETFSALLVAALGLLILRAPQHPDARTLICAAALAGMLVGSKVLNLAFAGPLGLLLLWRWRGGLPWRVLPAALLLAAFIGGASYTYAWILTGNPVLPLFNAVFDSSWAPASNISDPRWHRGLTLTTPFWLTFDAASYYEVGLPRGAGGLALLALGGGALGALVNPLTRAMLLAALLAWVLPLTQIQYLRYTVPALTLLLPALLAGLAMGNWQRPLKAFAIAVIALQLILLPSASWILAAGGVRALSREGLEQLYTDYAPERAIARYWREHRRPSDRLLMTMPENASHAEYSGAAFVSSWYDPRLRALILAAADPEEGWRRAIEVSGANYVLLNRDALPPGLKAYLTSVGAELERADGAAWLYRLPESATGGEVHVAPEGPVSVRFHVQQDSPRLLNVKLEVDCSRPFEPFSVGWSLSRIDRPTRYLFGNWQSCPANGKAEVGIELALPAGSLHLDLDMGPVSEGSSQRLDLLVQGAIDRPDLARERELSGRIRAATCWRWRMCREVDGPRLLWASD